MIKEYKTKLESSLKIARTKETKPTFRAQTAAKSTPDCHFSPILAIMPLFVGGLMMGPQDESGRDCTLPCLGISAT